MSNSIFPIFQTQAIQHNGKSEEAGRPIFEDREFVEIHIAGDNKSVVVKKVDDAIIGRWPEQYKAFKADKEAPLDGTPINEWPAITVSKAAELRAINIKTVESLAELKDTGIQRIGMGGRELVKKAQAFLKASKSTAAAQKFAAENVKLHDEIDMLKAQIKELADKMDNTKAA